MKKKHKTQNEWTPFFTASRIVGKTSSSLDFQSVCFSCQLNIFTCFVFSLISQIVFVLLPGRQPLHYHLCTNIQLDDLEFKPNWSLLILLMISFAIHIFVNVNIKILKAKKQNSYDVINFHDYIKCVDITAIEKQSISDFLTGFLSITASSTLIFASLIINWINPIEFTKVTFLIFLSQNKAECNILPIA